MRPDNRYLNPLRGPAAARFGAAAGLILACMSTASGGPLDTRAASCVFQNGGRGPKTGIIYDQYLPSTYLIFVPFGSVTISIPSRPTPGEILLAKEVPLPALYGGAAGRGAPLKLCPPTTIETFRGNGSPLAGTGDIYPTSVRGIGYRVYYYISNESRQTAPAVYQNPYSAGVLVYPMNTDNHPQGTNVRTRIEFVATGEPIASGTISSGVYGEGGVFGNVTPPIPALYQVRMSGTVTVAHPTCSITNPAALNVTLPEVSTSQLAASGTGDTTTTTLGVACSANRDDAPLITLRANSLASQVPGTLNNELTDSTAAKGVGVQVQYEMPSGNSVPFQQGIATAGAGHPASALPTNQWQFRLGARFARLGSAAELRPGKVRATATVTFTYN
ncbi:fimbrial protein [Castellaniella sp.]|uniref:fimbrial protein n=1 Tax=Castellaniella sp. TaxID=1955812 RepID=UPI002AFF0B5B|nr:fimbrial protein [Castellaniella sp.]